MTLRDYQDRCVTAIGEGFERKSIAQLIVMATGTGKTVVLSEATRVFGTRTLVIDHRDELTVQNGRKLVQLNPTADVAIEQGDRWAIGNEDIIIGSIQTLSRNNCKRLRRLLRYGAFDLVIIDEGHHAGALTYQAVIECLREYNPGVRVLGFTATPNRSDGKGLEKVFKEVIFTYTLRQAIEDGYLVDILAEKILTTTSLDGLHLQRGDFKQSELGDRVNNDERNSTIVKGWIDHASTEQTVVFCANVAHARSVTDLFCRQGVMAEMVIGETDTLIRKGIYDRYASRKTNVLVSVDVLTEGWDQPGTQCVYMARPTKSQLVYIQMLGRGTRPDVDLTGLNTVDERTSRILLSHKPHMHLLDVVDNTTNNSPIMLADLFGVPKNVKLRKTTIVQAAKRIEKAIADAPNIKLDKLKDIEKLQDLVTQARRVKIFEIEPPKEVKEHSRLCWIKQGDEYLLNLDKGETLVLATNALGQFEARVRSGGSATQESLGHADTLSEAFGRADKWVEGNYEDKLNLLLQSAKWMKDNASDKQINFLRRQGFPVTLRNGEPYVFDGGQHIKLTKGMARHKIGEIMNQWDSNAKKTPVPQSGEVKTHVLRRTMGSMPAVR
jgi:ATP-dependent helicase IRC3